MSLLFTPFSIRGVELPNRIMMSPMAMQSASIDGKPTDWHYAHYGARALGQVGLIMLESTDVTEQGRQKGQLGLWHDTHIDNMRQLVQSLHIHGVKVGIQLWHVGPKGNHTSVHSVPNHGWDPDLMNEEQIAAIVSDFGKAARRALDAGFDVIELHAAHGYMINRFLSPLTNHREDRYGGTRQRRYQFLKEIIAEVRAVWKGPLFVRVSANEYAGSEGNEVEDHVFFANLMKDQGVDLIDCSSGGLLPDKPHAFPGYQVAYSQQIRREAGIATAAVGLITNAWQAEEYLQNGRADLVVLGRALLRDPFWPRTAAEQLCEAIPAPVPYKKYWFNTSLSPEN